MRFLGVLAKWRKLKDAVLLMGVAAERVER